MKHVKRFASLLLALVMVLGLATTAFAAGTDGSITITNPVEGETYKAYLMFELESFSGDAYSYKTTEDWKDFVETGYGKNVFAVGEGYVTLKEGVTLDDDDAAMLAKEAVAYAKNKKLTAAATLTSAQPTATGLTLGYYVVDSSMGALCALTTTDKTVEITEKNGEPTIEKKVQEDSKVGESGEGWQKTNDADIGQVVNFKTIVHAKKGAQNYVVHDKMSDGLTLDQTSIAVAGATQNTDYTVAFNAADGCDFEITFKKDYLNKITGDTDIVITYSAVLNESALIYNGENTNETKLDYGDSSSTQWNKTVTYTYKFELVKTDSNNNIINGAKFELYDAKIGGNKIALVKEANGSYRPATSEEKAAAGFTSAVIEAGHVTIKGLDGNTKYYLEETYQPAGYNKLNERFEVSLAQANLDATVTNDIWTAGGAHVVNQSGTELPSTGGMGTRIFYVLGSILLVGASVLLITKKRMNAEK